MDTMLKKPPPGDIWGKAKPMCTLESPNTVSLHGSPPLPPANCTPCCQVIEMLKRPFKDDSNPNGKLELSQVHEPIHRCLHTMCVLSYKLLKAMVRGSARFALMLSEHIPFMQTHLGERLNASETLMEIFQNNRSLLEHLNEEILSYFVKICGTKKRHAQYLDFLCVLCLCDGTPVTRNQVLCHTLGPAAGMQRCAKVMQPTCNGHALASQPLCNATKHMERSCNAMQRPSSQRGCRAHKYCGLEAYSMFEMRVCQSTTHGSTTRRAPCIRPGSGFVCPAVPPGNVLTLHTCEPVSTEAHTGLLKGLEWGVAASSACRARRDGRHWPKCSLPVLASIDAPAQAAARALIVTIP